MSDHRERIIPKRIFVETSALTSSFQSGIGHTVLKTLRALHNIRTDRAGYEIVLLCPFDARSAIDKYELEFPVKTLPLPDRAIRLLRKRDLLPPLDLLIGQGIYIFPNYWNWPLVNSRAATYVYDLSFITHPEYTAPRNAAFLRRNIARWIRRSDLIITPSVYTRRLIADYYKPSADIAVAHCGVDDRFKQVATSQGIEAAKKRYGITGNYFLYVGNIEPRKNLSRLIAAYRMLPPATRANYGLVFVGADGWDNAQFYADLHQSQSRGFNIQKVEEFVPDADLPLIYAGAYALIHPSLDEGFGMTPLEAMAAGTPVIVSNVASLPEVVGMAGLYVDPNNTQDISAKIQALAESPSLYANLQKIGRDRAASFTWDQTANDLLKHFLQLAQ